MRRILLNHARDNNVNKRGGGASEINLDDAVIISPEKSKELIALDEVLEQSAKFY